MDQSGKALFIAHGFPGTYELTKGCGSWSIKAITVGGCYNVLCLTQPILIDDSGIRIMSEGCGILFWKIEDAFQVCEDTVQLES